MNIPESLLPQFSIVPTVLIPLTLVSVGLSMVATFIAALFGIKLKAEGPKRMLEVLLKPKVIGLALLMNLFIFLGVKGYHYVSNLPAFLWRIQRNNPENILQPNRLYENLYEIVNVWPGLSPLELQTLSPHWTQQLAKGVFRDPIVSGKSLFIGSNDGHVYELDQESGQVLRKFFVGTPVSSSPAIHNGALFTGEGEHDTHHARIYKFDLRSSKLLGTFATRGHIEAQAIFADADGETLMLVSAGRDGVYAVDPITLKARWHQVDGHVDSEAQIASGRVFVGSGREKEELEAESKTARPAALAYDLRTGKLLWRRELPASSWMRPVLLGKDVCFATGEIYFQSELGGLSCFDQSNGNPSVTINTQQAITGVPLAIGPMVYVVDIKSRVCALNTTSGLSEWCQKLPEVKLSYSSVIYDAPSGMLLVGHRTEGIYGLDPKDGAIILHYRPKDWAKTYGAIATHGRRWFIADSKGLVRALTPSPSVRRQESTQL